MFLISSFLEPHCCFLWIVFDTPAIHKTFAEPVLRLDVSTFCGHAVLLRHFHQISCNILVVIITPDALVCKQIAESEMCARISQLYCLSIPPCCVGSIKLDLVHPEAHEKHTSSRGCGCLFRGCQPIHKVCAFLDRSVRRLTNYLQYIAKRDTTIFE